MWKKIVFGIIISIFVAAGIYWFTYTKEIHTPVSEAINAIPSNAAIIFESKQSKNLWKKLSQTNVIWEEMLGTETVSKLNVQVRYVDSLIESNTAVSQLLDNRSLFISAHISGATTFDFLYVYSLPSLSHQSSIDKFFKEANNNSEPSHREYAGVDMGTIYQKKKDSLSYAFLKGILIMSSKQNLVEDGIRQLKSGISLLKDKNFSQIINTAGKNADANIYINYKNFPGILNHFISPAFKRETNSIADFADCSGWDVAIKPNAFMLNGFTQANDSSTKFLNLFRKQKPQDITLTKILPSKTSLLLFFGLSNVKLYQREYKNYLNSILQGRKQSYEQYIENINSRYHINIERSMLEWMDNEMALVITEPLSIDFANNAYAVIHSNAIDDAVSTLNTLADSINKIDRRIEKTEQKKALDLTNTHLHDKAGKKLVHPDKPASITPTRQTGPQKLPIKYRNHNINLLNLPKILPQLLGWQFSKLTKNYYTALDDYIVFANTTEALQSFINDFENNKTLANDKNYKLFAENVSAQANIYLYSSIARSPDIYSSFVTDDLAKDIENKLDLFHKFEAVGIQFTSSPKLFYSSLYLKYNPKYKQESGTLWESKLDTTLSSKPYLLINHNTKANEIFVQDDANTIYLISSTGKIIWKKHLQEKIMSDVIQIDALKNNKLQMLFNTRSAIHMFDRNGNVMRGFPIKLESPATNAISVVDYEKNRDYRIFVACENKKIRCFKPNGDEVTAFKFGKTDNIVYLPLQYLNMDNKDHLFAVDGKGKIYVLNRQGEMRLKLKAVLPQGIHGFYIEPGKEYSKSYLIAADTLGNIIKVSLSGAKESIRVQDFETSPYFEYRDVNKDKTKEFIFLTRNELKVFSQDKSLLFKYEFKERISQAPLFFIFPDGTGKIGVVSETSDELYLFNDNGSLYKGFPLSGKTSFSIGDLNNEGVSNLITGSSENSIYLYQLE